MNVTLLDDLPIQSYLKKEFHDRLSKRPYCSDDLGYGLHIRSKNIAKQKRYVQANDPYRLSWICLDVDYPCVLETTFQEKVLPTPNFIIINPENNHSHLLYGIEDMIYLSDNARLDPIRYAHAVSYALREAIKADIGYTNLIMKNPLNEHWKTIELEQNLWTLGQLAEYLVLPKKMPKREYLIGLGRNCTLFELGRKYAYSEVLKQKILGNKDSFFNAVMYFIEQQNKEFPSPLLFNEYKAITKSITNWTWRHYGDKSSSQWKAYVKRTHTPEMQAFRGKQNTSEQQRVKALKSAEIRFKGSNEQLKPWETLGISRGWYYTQKRLGNI